MNATKYHTPKYWARKYWATRPSGIVVIVEAVVDGFLHEPVVVGPEYGNAVDAILEMVHFEIMEEPVAVVLITAQHDNAIDAAPAIASALDVSMEFTVVEP